MKPADIGARVAQARAAAGLTQARLAREIDLDPTAVSKIESGVRSLGSYELARVCEALTVSPRWILGMRMPEPVSLLAARTSGPDADVDLSSVQTHIASLQDFASVLEDQGWLDAVTTADLASYAVELDDPVEAGERAAAALRAGLGLDSSPVPSDLEGKLESALGLDVLVLQMPGGLDGLLFDNAGNKVAAVSAGVTRSRLRFTLAHELAHLVFADADPLLLDRMDRSTAQEKRANAFAAAFLAPPLWVRDFCDQRDCCSPETIAQMAMLLGMSYAASVYRLHNLQFINASDRDRLLAASRRQAAEAAGVLDAWVALGERVHWRVPARLVTAGLAAYREGQIGVARLLDVFEETDAEVLRELLADQGIRPEGSTARRAPLV